ncbi:MAG: ABC transporter ATP-binding protein [Clostridia bacterium]|nr:ABC transporter ATP-binding protein [Clostridia bacterium]
MEANITNEEIKKEKPTKKNATSKKANQIKLCVKNLTKEYNSNKVVNNVSFDVYNGEFLSILGPSGCGKTTILRMLIGLIDPTSGTILKNGEDITNVKISKRGMGMVFQNYALFENMNVLQNIEYALKIKKETKAIARETALSLIKKMKLEECIYKKPNELSGGQQQRVAIARALALKPDIILFDEPMSALDVETRLSLCQELKNIQKKFATTMIYITHDQEEAFNLSDRIMVMDFSKIVQIGTPEEILKNPANNYVKKFVCQNLTKKINSLKRFVELTNEK